MEKKRRCLVCRVALAFLGAIVLLLAVVPLLIPVGTTGTMTAYQLANADSAFITVNGLEVHYNWFPAHDQTNDDNSDRLIVLLHGFGASSYSWREVAAPLTRYAAVIAFDRPGFGLTERPLSWEGPNPYGPEAQVELLRALIVAKGAKEAVLIGNSAGGTVAMNFALTHPQMTAGLVLISPAVFTGGGAPPWTRVLFQLPQVNRLGPLLARQIASSGDEFLRSSWFNPQRIDPQVIEQYRKPLQIINWEQALWQFTRASRAADITQRLSELTMPVLVVTGDTDRIVPTEQSVRLAAELLQAQLVVIAESGHLAHEETPAEFMNAVGDFWRTYFSARL